MRSVARAWQGTWDRLPRRAGALPVAFLVVALLGGCASGNAASAASATPSAAEPTTIRSARIAPTPEVAGAAAPAPVPAPAPAPQAEPPASAAPAAPVAPERVPGNVLARRRAETFSPREIDEMGERFYVYGNALPARYPVDWYRIQFASTDLDGSPLRLVAQVFVPRAAGQALPVYGFGPGTTGLKDECAPSHEQPEERNWGDFEAHLLSFAAQGYVAVMPDYAGSGGPDGLQYYYVAEMHARTMLDAARAALRFTAELGATGQGAHAENAIFFAGYSQGGHAALAARDAAARYAPELHVKGVIGYGARGDVKTMLFEAPYLGPYLLYSYAHVYGADKVALRDLLVPTVMQTLDEDIATKCIDEVPTYYGDYSPWIFQPAFDDAVDHGRLAQSFPALNELLDQNNVGQAQSDVPVLLLQGLADTLVTPQTQRAFVRRLCGVGATVTLNLYEDIPHVLTRQVSYRDTLAWMAAVLDGQTPQSSCGGR